ncbi:hypothetical protein D3C84_1011810 [compost metagenome]
MGGLPEQVEFHDGQEVGWHEQQQCGQHQGQGAAFHLGAVHHQFIAAAGAAGLLLFAKVRATHQQVALVAGNKIVQR